MVATIVISALIAGYVIFLVVKAVSKQIAAKKTGVPAGCSCCSSYKGGCCSKKAKCESTDS